MQYVWLRNKTNVLKNFQFWIKIWMGMLFFRA